MFSVEFGKYIADIRRDKHFARLIKISDRERRRKVKTWTGGDGVETLCSEAANTMDLAHPSGRPLIYFQPVEIAPVAINRHFPSTWQNIFPAALVSRSKCTILTAAPSSSTLSLPSPPAPLNASQVVFLTSSRCQIGVNWVPLRRKLVGTTRRWVSPPPPRCGSGVADFHDIDKLIVELVPVEFTTRGTNRRSHFRDSYHMNKKYLIGTRDIVSYNLNIHSRCVFYASDLATR